MFRKCDFRSSQTCSVNIWEFEAKIQEKALEQLSDPDLLAIWREMSA